jgi:hypothetical protein
MAVFSAVDFWLGTRPFAGFTGLVLGPVILRGNLLCDLSQSVITRWTQGSSCERARGPA